MNSPEEGAADEQPPEKWWTTPFVRSLTDFEGLSAPDAAVPFFNQMETIAGYVEQRTALSRKLEVFMVLSFLTASLVLAGGLPKDTQITIFGFEGPSNLITLPLLAALSAGLFSRFAQVLCSFTILSEMINRVLTRAVPHGPEFVVARYDASYLWMNLLRKRTSGYKSPLAHTLIGGSISVVGLLWLVLHIVVAVAANWVAVSEAAANPGWWTFPFFIASAALLMTTVTVLHLVVGFFVPAPYRLANAMAESATA